MSWKLVVVAAMGAWNALAAVPIGSAAAGDDSWRMLPIDGGGYVIVETGSVPA